MGVKFNPFTGNLDLVGAAAGGGGTPGGADTQVQFNDDGSFGGSADLTWDDTGKVLDVGGDINLDDGGSFQTTLQLVTPTAARTITFPDATGTVGLVAGSTGQLVFNLDGAYSGGPLYDNTKGTLGYNTGGAVTQGDQQEHRRDAERRQWAHHPERCCSGHCHHRELHADQHLDHCQ
jgi:hypothetical protein